MAAPAVSPSPLDALLDAVRERPYSPELLLVYADGLQLEGWAQGQLVVLQAALERAAGHRAGPLDAQKRELLGTHRQELLGPAHQLSKCIAGWRLGFARSLEVELTGERQLGKLIESLRTTSFALLERLHLRFGRVDDLGPLFDVLPPSVHTVMFEVRDEFDWTEQLQRPVRVLHLGLCGGSIDFEAVALPGVRTLTLGIDVENLPASAVPALEVLNLRPSAPWNVINWPEAFDPVPRGLRLVRHAGELEAASDLPTTVRFVEEHSSDEVHGDGEPLNAEAERRVGWGVGGERAFVLTTAPAPVIDLRLEALNGTSRDLFRFSRGVLQTCGTNFSVVELIAPNRRGDLLVHLAVELALKGYRALEVAVSPSNRDCMVREHLANEQIRPLAMGSSTDAEAHFRRAVELAFGFDPGPVLDDAHAALDAMQPERFERGKARGIAAWYVVSPFGARDAWEMFEFDEFGDPIDPYELDETAIRDPWKAPPEAPPEPDAVPLAVAAAPASEEASPIELEPAEPGDEAPEPDEPLQLATLGEDEAPEGWAQVLGESPIELESEGSEPTPEKDHDWDFVPIDVEQESVAAFDEHGPPSCTGCGEGFVKLAECALCCDWVCAHCSKPRAKDGRRVCTGCA